MRRRHSAEASRKNVTIQLLSMSGTAGRTSRLPSLAKEGWPRHQENAPVPLKGADGVVRSTSDNRWLEPTTPSAPAKEASPHFLYWAQPPLLSQGGEFAFP